MSISLSLPLNPVSMLHRQNQLTKYSGSVMLSKLLATEVMKEAAAASYILHYTTCKEQKRILNLIKYCHVYKGKAKYMKTDMPNSKYHYNHNHLFSRLFFFIIMRLNLWNCALKFRPGNLSATQGVEQPRLGFP